MLASDQPFWCKILQNCKISVIRQSVKFSLHYVSVEYIVKMGTY